MKRPPFEKLGISDVEREINEAERRDHNCVIAIVVVMVAGYFGLLLIGGPI